MLESRRCPVCATNYDAQTQFCLKDGTKLESTQTLIGRILHERYRIDKLIGQGGMGVVYRATHIDLEDKFAIKVLNPELVDNASAISRFRQEARAARAIKHPNAVGVTDFGVTPDNLVYLVMEFVEGRSLRDLMQEGIFDYHRAVRVLCQVCAAIEAAHHNKIIHRDLKPENILVQGAGYKEIVKVADFGIAKLLEEDPTNPQRGALTKAGTIIGTPQYMSPEQCRNKNLSPVSDIYAIGIVGYEMLSGATPFVGSCATDYFVKHIYEIPVPLHQLVPQVPEIISREIMRAIEKDPLARHQSAAEVARCLRSAVKEIDGTHITDPFKTSLVEGEEEVLGSTRKLHNSGSQPPQTEVISYVPKSRENQPIGNSQSNQEPQSINSSQSSAELQSHIERRQSKMRLTFIALSAVVALILSGFIYWLSTRPSVGKTLTDNRPLIFSDEFGVMVLVRGGKFTMGRNDGENFERPAHDEEVNDFYLDKYEVTNQQYKKFIDATGQPPPKGWAKGLYAPEDATLPVTNVTWRDAVSYAKWAGRRLPTEAEWEYAARGGNKEWLYPWGNEWKEGYSNVGHPERRKPASVFRYDTDQSPFGVYGLAGNVSEWVYDPYRERYDSQPNADVRMIRGGNFLDDHYTSTYRLADYPDVPRDPKKLEDRREYELKTLPKVGFRCAKDASR